MNGSELVAVWKEGAGLRYWQTAYGRYEPSQGTYTSYYYIKDHLGSTRVVLSETGQRTEATDYYAFGMKMGGRSYHLSTKDGYTTKERDAETGWDYFGARYYLPHLGRFNRIDRFAEKYPFFTPFQYAGNNPMNFTDVNGDSIKTTQDVVNALNSSRRIKTRYELNSNGMMVVKKNPNFFQKLFMGRTARSRERVIKEAIGDKNIQVNLISTGNNTITTRDGKNINMVGGLYDGASTDNNGKVQTTQYINLGHLGEIQRLTGDPVSGGVAHEIIESFYGGQQFPNNNFDEQNFQTIHGAAASLDMVQPLTWRIVEDIKTNSQRHLMLHGMGIEYTDAEGKQHFHLLYNLPSPIRIR
jgi:RHS repeat-associated protein